MQVKHLFVTITLLFSLLLSSLSQARNVSIPDANLAAAIRAEIGNSITTDTLLNLTRLEARNSGIKDLTGLERAHNLEVLDLSGEYIEGEGIVNSNTISDFSPIARLTNLRILNLSDCSISDIAFLAKLTQLIQLDLSSNPVADVSPLAGLTQLSGLYLYNTSISDVSALSGLIHLTDLGISSGVVSDVSPLSGLTQLTFLDLGGNAISDIAALKGLTQLTYLYLWDNAISDISSLSGLMQLRVLDLNYNAVLDVSPLVKLNLKGTEWDDRGLFIGNNPLNYAAIYTHIPAIKRKGIEVQFDERVPTTLLKISDTVQEGIVNTVLPLPFVVEVLDQEDRAFAGVPVTFAVTAGRGKLDAKTVQTDAMGKAAARLTLGRTEGTTTIRVIATDISEPVEFTATAIRRSTPVMIPDTNLRMKIMETLRKPLDETPTASDMLTLTTLTANDADIYDLTGLQHAANLTTLSLNNNYITDGTPLAALTQLTKVSLNNNSLWALEPLTGLTELTTLSLEYNSLSDIKPLTVLPQLKTLHLRGNWLDNSAFDRYIPAMQTKGIDIRFNPRTKDPRPVVRLIYFYPRDREPLPDIDEQMDRSIKEIQEFYADQMEAHGFGRKTFLFETDTEGRAVIHHVKGRFSHKDYQEDWQAAWQEAGERFDRSNAFLLTVLDVDLEGITPCGRGGGNGRTGGGFVTAREWCSEVSPTAHELGHAFGLLHDYTRADGKWIPSKYTSDRMMTSFCAAEWLDVIPLFNTGAAPINHNTTIKMLPPSLASSPNILRLSFEINDLDGIQQVQFFTNERSGWAGLGPEYPNLSTELADYKGLKGSPDDTVEFLTTQVKYKNKAVIFQSIDVHGNITLQEFPVDITALLPPPKVVLIPDPHLASVVREQINRITTHTLLDLTALDVRNHGIKNLTGLEHAHNLKRLDLGGEYIEGEGTVNSNAISDFSPLAGLSQLAYLHFSDTGISNVSELADLTQLTELHLSDNNISNISPLGGLTQLMDLNLNGNVISNISALSGLTQLTSLNLDGNAITDISALSGLTQLTSLYLGENVISDISALSGLTQLKSLYLWNNRIGDVSPLKALTQLTSLDLSGNAISDVSPLVKLNLTGTEWETIGLYIKDNPLNLASLNTHIPAMQAKGVEVQFDIPPALLKGGPKIEGPWLWVLLSGTQLENFRSTDLLAQVSGGKVTELNIATDGTVEGESVGDSVWTSHKISATGGNNINDLLNALSISKGNVNENVVYGSIILDSPHEQETKMFAGSDDNHKVWLNGKLVNEQLNWDWAADYQESFPVTLKRGKNVLLVAVHDGGGGLVWLFWVCTGH